MKSEIVLVTGSSGYVGSHTVKYLSQHGYRVIGLDEVPPSPTVRHYLTDDLVADISFQGVPEFLKQFRISGVIHCAAKCLVGESVEKPELYHDYNVVRSSTFLDFLEEAQIRPIVFSSTAATYGEPKTVPIPESHPQEPINPYGKTKLQFEKYLLRKGVAKVFTVGIFRYFNAAGADPEGEIGEIHDPETHLIPNAVLTAVGKKKSFSIFGNDYKTRDGTCERDYVHVWDLASAHLMLLERMMKRDEGGVFNLGTSKGYTIQEVLNEIDQQTGKKIDRILGPRRPGDPAVLIADARLARENLKWLPKFSSLETIVETSLRFHRK